LQGLISEVASWYTGWWQRWISAAAIRVNPRQIAGIGVTGETVRERFDCLRLSLETRNLIQVARLLASAALMREESRGGHFRLDFPERDDARFLASIVLWNEDGQVRGELRPVPGMEVAEPPLGAVTIAAAA